MAKAWAQFQTDVYDLLRLQGWEVQPEIQLGHKKVDGIGTKRGDFNELRTIAIECKDYGEPLALKLVTEVFADYFPLVDNKEIDQLLIITRRGLHPGAASYVKSNAKIIHATFLELQNSTLDLAAYVAALTQPDDTEDFDGIYVQQD